MKRISLLLFLPIFLFSCSRLEKQEKVENKGVMFGIDISQYQTVDWNVLSKQEEHPIEFCIVRATMGTRQDRKFSEYFSKAREHGLLVGAYHYYDPNENSTLQAENFLNKVSERLREGDLIPVLDIERLSRVQSNANLKQGLENWCCIVENKFGVKPIIYTSLTFWEDYLEDKFSDHPLWLASYSSGRRGQTRDLCHIHQFTEDVIIPGVKEPVDGNDINIVHLPLLVLR
jgi:lysozyme